MIDDRVKYARNCAGTLDTVLLFGDYAWNDVKAADTAAAKLARHGSDNTADIAVEVEPEPLPANVRGVKDWEAAEAALMEVADRLLPSA